MGVGAVGEGEEPEQERALGADCLHQLVGIARVVGPRESGLLHLFHRHRVDARRVRRHTRVTYRHDRPGRIGELATERRHQDMHRAQRAAGIVALQDLSGCGERGEPAIANEGIL